MSSSSIQYNETWCGSCETLASFEQFRASFCERVSLIPNRKHFKLYYSRPQKKQIYVVCYKIICFLPPVIQGNINTKEIHNSPPSVMSFSAICDVLLCHLWCLSLPFCDLLILDLYPYMGGYKSSPCDVNVSYNSFLTINTFNERINSKSIHADEIGIFGKLRLFWIIHKTFCYSPLYICKDIWHS